MSSRVAGAGLALIAAALLAAVIATPVLVPAEYSLFAGHPTVNGRTRETQEVYVGLYDARLCNSGGDQTCKSGGPTQPFRITGFGVLGATGVMLLGSLALVGMSISNSKRRRGVGIVVRIAGVLALGGAVGLVLQPPFREAGIPLNPIGAGLYGAAILMGLLASLVAGRKPSVQRSAERGKPAAAAPPVPSFDVQAMFANDTGPAPRTAGEAHAANGMPAAMTNGAPHDRPAQAMDRDLRGAPATGFDAPHVRPTQAMDFDPRGAPQPTGFDAPHGNGAEPHRAPHAAGFDLSSAPHATSFEPHSAPHATGIEPHSAPHAAGFDPHSAPGATDFGAPGAIDFGAPGAIDFGAPGPQAALGTSASGPQPALGFEVPTTPGVQPAMSFEGGAAAQDGSRKPPPPPRSKGPSAPPPNAQTRTQPSVVPPMPPMPPMPSMSSGDPASSLGAFDLSAAYDPPPSVMPDGSGASTDMGLYPGLDRNAPSPRERVDTPLAPPPPPIAQPRVIPPPWATDNASFDPAAFETGHAHALETVRFETPALPSALFPAQAPADAAPAAASSPATGPHAAAPPSPQPPSPQPPSPQPPSPQPASATRTAPMLATPRAVTPSPALTPVPTLTPAALTAMLPPPLPRPPRENFSRIDRNPLAPIGAPRANVPMPARAAPPTTRPPVPPTRPAPRTAAPPAVIPVIPTIRPIPAPASASAPLNLDDLDDGPALGKETISDEVGESTNVSVDIPLPGDPGRTGPRAKVISTAPDSLPPPKLDEQADGPSPACPQCESPMDWVDEHLRFYCKSCRMYF